MNGQIAKWFGGATITQPMGLSQLLTFHGMGMGHMTSKALTHMQPPFLGLDDAVRKFNAAIAADLLVSNTRCWGRMPSQYLAHEYTPKEKAPVLPSSSRRQRGRRAAAVAVEDSMDEDVGSDLDGRMAGKKGKKVKKAKKATKATAKASTGPKMKAWTLESKLATYFSSPVETLWKAFLTTYDLVGVDPSTTDTPRPTAQDFIDSEIGRHLADAVTPFKGESLTRVQLIASLIQLNVLAPYSEKQMASMIVTLNKGAQEGLAKLGFDTRSDTAVKQAFCAFHQYILDVLPEHQRRYLNYTTSTSEHLLCKVGRWIELGRNVWTDEWWASAAAGDWIWREYDEVRQDRSDDDV